MHAMLYEFVNLFHELQAPPMTEHHFIIEHLMKATTGVLATSKRWPGDMYKDALK